MKALVIPTSVASSMKIVELGENQLQSFYKIIGCRVIDYLTLGSKGSLAIDAVIDDEALLQQCPVANQRFCIAYCEGLMHCPIFGTVVIVMTNENTGETTELNLQKVKQLLTSQYGFSPNDFPSEV